MYRLITRFYMIWHLRIEFLVHVTLCKAFVYCYNKGMKILALMISFVVLNLSAAVVELQCLKATSLVTGEKVEISLKDVQQKGWVVIFMSAKCPCSNTHIEVIKKSAQQFKDFQFVIVHSNSDESKSEAEIYFKKANFDFPVLQDDKGQWADSFKAFKTPHAFVLDQTGKILYQGGVTNSSNAASASQNFLNEALQNISDKKPVAIASGRTLGCMIIR